MSAEQRAIETSESAKFFTFVNLALFMAVVTGVELVVIFIPLPYAVLFTIIIVLSLVKFIGVLTWFMHLIYDKALCTLMFAIGMLLALGTFTALAFLFSAKDIDRSNENAALSVRQVVSA